MRLHRYLAVVLIGMVALLGVGLLHPGAAKAAAKTNAPPRPASAAGAAGPGRSAPELSVPNPFDWFFENAFANPFKAGTQKTLKTAMDASEASFLTPSLDSEARVQQLWKILLMVADALLLLLIVVGAVMVIAGDWSYLEAKALAPRVIVAGVAANLSLIITGLAIGWSNDLVKGFLSFGNATLSPAVSNMISTERTAVILALLLIVVLLLLVANLLRLVIVLTLAVAGPLMIVFGVLPASDGIARMWYRAMAACLIAPVVQALLMVLGVWIAASGSPFASTFSSVAGSNLVDSVMLIVIILLMAISPLWMLKRALGESHQHLASAFRLGRHAVGVLS
ncbi:MAG TPA: hypothetical protein VHA57_04405 [Actinomycetota bacterium]|nr:hypothetical protein [Actinomycetota bacterium]